MFKLDTSIYKGFLKTLERAMQDKYFVTLHFYRDPTVRGYITEIDKEVYVATIESEEGNYTQIRLNQITSLMWKKNGNETLNLHEERTKNRKKNLAIMNENKEKMEEETATEYMKRKQTENKNNGDDKK